MAWEEQYGREYEYDPINDIYSDEELCEDEFDEASSSIFSCD